jgi:transducin (beta)-like 1
MAHVCGSSLARRDSVYYQLPFLRPATFWQVGHWLDSCTYGYVMEGIHVKSFKGNGDIFEVAWNVEETRVAACFSSNSVSVIDFKREMLPGEINGLKSKAQSLTVILRSIKCRY